MRRLHFRILVLSVEFAVLLTAHELRASAATAALTAADLKKLPKADCVVIVTGIFRDRIEKSRNIEVVSSTRISECPISDGQVGDPASDFGLCNFRLLRLDGSYRLETVWFLTQDAVKAEASANANYLEKDGIVRWLGDNVGAKGQFGRIDVKHAPSIRLNPVALWLGGSFENPREFLFQNLVESAEQWNIDFDVERNQATISYPIKPRYIGEVKKRSVVCDVSKGLFPVKIETDLTFPDYWQKDETLIESNMQVDGLWMPTRIETRGTSKKHKQNFCSLYLTEVQQVILGRVNPSDLEVVFPEHTRVVDAIKGITYFAGTDGAPKGRIQSLGVAANAPTAPVTESTMDVFRVGMLCANAAIVAIVAVVLILRRRMRMT